MRRPGRLNLIRSCLPAHKEPRGERGRSAPPPSIPKGINTQGHKGGGWEGDGLPAGRCMHVLLKSHPLLVYPPWCKKSNAPVRRKKGPQDLFLCPPHPLEGRVSLASTFSVQLDSPIRPSHRSNPFASSGRAGGLPLRSFSRLLNSHTFLRNFVMVWIGALCCPVPSKNWIEGQCGRV
jgi:hypothetical protein